MDHAAKPTPEELRKAQAALDAANLAYEYFAPLAQATPKSEAPEYFGYVKAA